uniref:Glycoprotein IX (platelet) n=1 Tax=Salarias fasciatus TaxID=181472 RepID=A0A672J7Y7_SALFA
VLCSLSLALFLLLATSNAQGTGKVCLCSASPHGGLLVNCTSLSLMELPRLPSHTTELYAHNNRLTSVAPGLFDRLVGLRKVSLSENPFHCDCRIQYLRNWLLKNKGIVQKEPVCASPSSLAHTLITDLSDDFFSSCALAKCTDGMYNIVMAVMLCGLIALLLWSLRLARKSTITLCIDKRHSGFEADSLRSLKPKHRRRLHTGTWDSSSDMGSGMFFEDQERPLLNMELLPQVLDVLHKKHNIKIKAT